MTDFDESAKKLKENPDSTEAANEAYTASRDIASKPDGIAKFNNAFRNDQSGALPSLQLKWGEEKLSAFDKNAVKDGLSLDEINKALQPGAVTRAADKLFLSQLRDNFAQIAGKDGDGKTITIADLQKAKQDAADRRITADLKKVFPNEAAFKALDVDRNSSDKITSTDLVALKTGLDATISNTTDFNKLPPAKQQELKAKQRVVNYLNNPDNLKKIAGNGNDGITFENINNFLGRAGTNPSQPQKVNAAEAVQRTMLGNNNARFNALATEQEIDGKPKEASITKESLDENIKTLDEMIKEKEGSVDAVESNKAYKAILEHMQTNFDRISSVNNDGSAGISKKDIEGYKPSQAAKDLREIFGDEFNATSFTMQNIAERAAAERTKAAATEIDLTPERERQVKFLESMSDANNPDHFKRFSDIAKVGQPEPSTSGSPPPPPLPADVETERQKFAGLIDRQDLETLEKAGKDLLVLPKDVKTNGFRDGVKEGVRDWGTSKLVYGDNFSYLRYEDLANNRITFFDPVIDSATGNQKMTNGERVWSTYNAKDSNNQPIDPKEVIFTPHLGTDGKIYDTGRFGLDKYQPRQGYTIAHDWDSDRPVYVDNRILFSK